QEGHVLRYGATASGQWPALWVVTGDQAPSGSMQEVCQRAELLTIVEPGNALVHRFRFAVSNWRKRELLVVLPVGTQKVLAASSNGRWLDRLAVERPPDGF